MTTVDHRWTGGFIHCKLASGQLPIWKWPKRNPHLDAESLHCSKIQEKILRRIYWFKSVTHCKGNAEQIHIHWKLFGNSKDEIFSDLFEIWKELISPEVTFQLGWILARIKLKVATIQQRKHKMFLHLIALWAMISQDSYIPSSIYTFFIPHSTSFYEYIHCAYILVWF